MCIFVFHVPEMILNTDYFMLLFIKTLFYHKHIGISSILPWLQDMEGSPFPGRTWKDLHSLAPSYQGS